MHRKQKHIAIAEVARNLTCSGARLLAVTDNLNVANPHNPELFWQLRESVEGLADGCREFGTPLAEVSDPFEHSIGRAMVG